MFMDQKHHFFSELFSIFLLSCMVLCMSYLLEVDQNLLSIQLAKIAGFSFVT